MSFIRTVFLVVSLLSALLVSQSFAFVPNSRIVGTTPTTLRDAIITGTSISTTRLRQQQESGKGFARFTGIQETDATSGFDFLLGLMVSDVGSIALGLIGLLVAVSYRLANQDELSTDTLGQETRTDLLAVFACGAVLLNGISKLDVTSALAEAVILDGVELQQPEYVISESPDLTWAMESILKATPSKTAILLNYDSATNNWRTSVAAGIVPSDPLLRQGPVPDVSTPMMDRIVKDGSKETYLPTLQAIPGRVELSYLPPNTQAALLLPVVTEGSVQVLVLGSDTAKSFTPRDVAWCQVLATRIGTMLSR